MLWLFMIVPIFPPEHVITSRPAHTVPVNIETTHHCHVWWTLYEQNQVNCDHTYRQCGFIHNIL